MLGAHASVGSLVLQKLVILQKGVIATEYEFSLFHSVKTDPMHPMVVYLEFNNFSRPYPPLLLLRHSCRFTVTVVVFD